MRDGFVFYRSFFECFEGLSKKDKLVLFDALCNYALNDIEPELVGVPSAIFKLLKPQVDANNRRYENGKKGGRPKQNQDETKAEPNDNQTITKTEPKEQEQEQEQDKDKVKVNAKEQPQDNALGSSGRSGGGFDSVYGIEDEFNIWKKLTPDDVDTIYESYPNTGGDLIQAVYEDVKKKKKKVGNAVAYILGYADKVRWDDNADHVS